MFIIYNTSVETEHYIVNSANDACKQCGNSENLIVKKDVTTIKLFWLLPIFRWTSYSLQCSACGKHRKLSKTEGEALVILSEHQERNTAEQDEQASMVFDEFSNEPSQTEAAASTATRQITITRKKAFAGGAVPIIVSINKQEVCRLKNGETKSFTAPVGKCNVTLVLAPNQVLSLATIPEGTQDLKYETFIKGGWDSSSIILSPIE